MTTQEVADKLVGYCKQGNFRDALTNLYSNDIVSIEATAPPDGAREVKGIEAVKGKGDWWVSNHDIHSVIVEGPLVAGDQFCVCFKMDVTFKPTSKRHVMEELGVYHVSNGKVDREEFFYKTM